MPRVELIYDRDCPNIEQARKALIEGFQQAQCQPAWTEWDRKSPASPAHARHYASPTILVNGREVTGTRAGAAADACSIYDHGCGKLSGAPPVPSIVAALQGGAAKAGPHGWSRMLATLPGVGTAMLPVVGCPVCWTASAGILGSFGAGVLLQATYLLPITVGFLALALFALAYHANARRGFWPLLLGSVSVAAVLLFKFVYMLDPFVYAGLFGLVVATLWNAWPLSEPVSAACQKCLPRQTAQEISNASHKET